MSPHIFNVYIMILSVLYIILSTNSNYLYISWESILNKLNIYVFHVGVSGKIVLPNHKKQSVWWNSILYHAHTTHIIFQYVNV